MIDIPSPDVLISEDKERYTLYMPDDLLEKIDKHIELINENRLLNGKIDKLTRSQLIETALSEWFYSHSNIVGLDDVEYLGYSQNKSQVTVYISVILISLVKYTAMKLKRNISDVIVNALDWYLSMHWGEE